MVALARSAEGIRLGLDTGPVAEHPDGGDHRQRALRAWSSRALLIDRFLEAEADRLGVTEPGSPQGWAEALDAAGELGAEVPTEAEARACYQANHHRYQLREARSVRHVLLADEASAARLATALAGPGALAEAAGALSLDVGTRTRGGHLGWVERGQLAGPLEEAIFAARPGEICGPLESGFGWHLLVVEVVREARARSFDECHEEIMSELAADRRREAWRQWWERRVAGSITVPEGDEQILLPGLPGTSHRH
jgi:hypothetical protein